MAKPGGLRYHDTAGARPLPAGRVLVIGVLALLLAALFNADGLHELAVRQPVGWKRDVATGVVKPFCVVGKASRLTEIRTAIRRAADKEAKSCRDRTRGSDAFVTPTVPSTTTAPAPSASSAPVPPTTHRAPTATAPLRLWLGGDSMAMELARAMEDALLDRPELDLTTHAQVSSGLTRPDYFDWPAYFRDEALATDPEVMVVIFGANDSQGMEIDGSAFQPSSTEWRAEYRRRVGVVMDQLRGDGRLLVWVGQPHMRDAGFDGRMGVLNDIYADEAGERPWVRFLDTRPVLAPDGGGYQVAAGGTTLRTGDGIHMTRAGAARVARAVLDVVADEVTGPAPDPPTTTTPAPSNPG